ncbi:MAG: hypothetical protein QM765_13455 [Myxococcales bacterium]
MTARLEGLGLLSTRIAAAPAEDRERAGTSGLVAGPGKLALPTTAPPATLYLSAGPAAAAAAARRSMGATFEPATSRAIARVTARLAQWKGTSEPGPELRAAALADVAALLGLAHPEGVFGAYDGAPADSSLTLEAMLALALAHEAGLPVEEGLSARGAERLKAAKDRGAIALLALALLEELPEDALGSLLETELAAESAGQLGSVSDRAALAWALESSGRKAAAREVALRLEKSARSGLAGTCFVDACPLVEPSRETVRATALATLALRRVLPKSPVLAGALRFLLAHRGAGDFGGDPAGGLAALAVAEAAGALTPYGASASVEVAGRLVSILPRLSAESESRVELPAGAAALNVAGGGGLLLWRIERSVPVASGAVQVERLWTGPGGESGEAIKLGDRVEVTLTIRAEEKTGPVRIDDPYPAGLSPVEQEGEQESFRKLDERSRRLLLSDRVVFFLPSLKAGETVLRWQATAKVAGTFLAPPARVEAGAQRGQSEAGTLQIEEGAR